MPDLDDLIAAEQQPPVRACKYLRLVADLTDHQRKQLEQLTAPAVARVLTSYGRPISGKGVSAHRDGGHTCG